MTARPLAHSCCRERSDPGRAIQRSSAGPTYRHSARSRAVVFMSKARLPRSAPATAPVED
jgi:hypothetical protein